MLIGVNDMMFLLAYKHMLSGKIARCKHSYFCLCNGYLCRVHRITREIQGLATVTGEIFATENWELLDETPKESKKWTL